ncbi:hypothetical protein [Demequina litorisediminis]|uniref:hypothetical protein n=1 Tax=Demequina litorisediminis TaxID=1849022 RepID=UPI0024E0E98B|nr:hypothetical protein [Demequina litorisediminis]
MLGAWPMGQRSGTPHPDRGTHAPFRIRSSLRLQLVTFGALAVLATSGTLTVIASHQASQFAAQATADVERLTDENLSQTTSTALDLVSTQVETVTDRMESELAVALATLDSLGSRHRRPRLLGGRRPVHRRRRVRDASRHGGGRRARRPGRVVRRPRRRCR